MEKSKLVIQIDGAKFTDMYGEEVDAYSIAEELRNIAHVVEEVGFPGALGDLVDHESGWYGSVKVVDAGACMVDADGNVL